MRTVKWRILFEKCLTYIERKLGAEIGLKVACAGQWHGALALKFAENRDKMVALCREIRQGGGGDAQPGADFARLVRKVMFSFQGEKKGRSSKVSS